MRNINNLNEEVKRIKSLFGEQRLYGNLVDESLLVNEEKELITEGVGTPIVKFLDSMVSSLVSKGAKKVSSNVDGVRTVYKISPEGAILKNGKNIDGKKVSDFLSVGLSNRIGRQLDEIASVEQNFIKYLSTEGYQGISLKKHLNSIIDDFKNQNLISEGQALKYKNEISRSGVFETVAEIFKTKKSRTDFVNSINGDMDFGKNYPGIFEIFDTVPQLKKGFYKSNLFDDGKILSDEYDSFVTIIDILREFEGVAEDGKTFSVFRGYFNGDILNLNYNQTKKFFSLSPSSPSDLPPELVRELRKEVKRIKEVNPDVLIEIKNNGTINFSGLELKKNEQDMLWDIRNGISNTPEKITTKPVKVKIRDVEFDVEDMLDDNVLRRKTDFDTSYYKAMFTNFLKNSLRGIKSFFKSRPMTVVVDLVSTRLSRFCDPNYLRKNGYIATSSSGTKQINEQWQSTLNGIWKVENPVDGSNAAEIFVKTEKESLLYGLEIGSLKPNLIHQENWKVNFKESYIKYILWGKVPLGSKSTYRAIGIDKTIRNAGLQIGAVYGVANLISAGYYWVVYGYAEHINQMVVAGKKVFTDKFKGENINPNVVLTMTKASYERKCIQKIKGYITKEYGANAKSIIDSYFEGEGQFSEMSKIEVTPRKFPEKVGGYDDNTNFPTLEEVKYNINSMNIVGVYKGLGEIIKDGDSSYWLITEVSKKKIPLNCEPKFKEFWEESWGNIYSYKNDPDALENKMVEIGDDVSWSELMGENAEEELKKAYDEMTIEATTQKIEDILDDVKETGGELQKSIENSLDDKSGGMGVIARKKS